MNIALIMIGKTDSKNIETIVEDYLRRINYYTRFEPIVIPDLKNARNLTEEEQKRRESELILKQIGESDYVVLLDERGIQMRSIEFAAWLQKRMNSGIKRLCFVIGGPYGFSQELYDRANSMLSLSKMTFSHQIIRAIFAEQLYRGFTILNNEPYHHE